MKREGYSHVKFKLVAKDLGIPLCYVIGIAESLWQETGIHFPGGDIGRYSNEEIALAIDYRGDAELLIQTLVNRRLLDQIPDEDGRLYVHGWHEHCDDHTKQRLRNRSQTFANGLPPYQKRTEKDTESQTSTEDNRKEQKSTATSLLNTAPEPEPEPEPAPEPDAREASNGHKPNRYFQSLEETFFKRTLRSDEWPQVEDQLDCWHKAGYRITSKWFEEACIDARASCKEKTGRYPFRVTWLLDHLTELIGEMTPRDV